MERMGGDLALYGGVVHTMVLGRPPASAVGVRRGRIAVVGTDAEVRAAMGPVDGLDLRGRTVIPGLNDAHLHLLMYSLARTELDLAGARSIAAVAELVAARAAATPPGGWIVAHGWHADRLAEGRPPTCHDLDPHTPAHPVALYSQDHHSCWLNSRALAAAGIGPATPDPPDGRIARDAHGLPTGLLLEGATRAVAAARPAPGPDEVLAALRAGIAALHRLGLTSATSMEGATAFTALQQLHAAGELTLRVYHAIPVEGLDAALALGIRSGLGDALLRLGHLKLFADGTLGSRTAHMLAPFTDEPGNCGLALLPYPELRALVRRAASGGIAPCIHAIGDAANRAVLDVYDEARRDGLLAGLRPRIEHAQLLDPEDRDRLAVLGVVASAQPLHCPLIIPAMERGWGVRGAGAFLFASLLRSGVTLAFGSDAPVADADPLAGIHAAVTRQVADGTPAAGWYPAERIDATAALRAYTVGAAYASGEEGAKGTLAPGMLGDLTVLSRDILAAPPSALRDTRVELTVVGGEVVYAA
jgi:predicted amidohydrolase YtcJ